MLGATRVPFTTLPDEVLREVGKDIGRERRLVAHGRRRLLRRARRDGARSLLRRRRAGALRLHALRRLHGRLPPRREEHARQELPLARREARREGRGRHGGHVGAAARRRRLRDHGAHRPLAVPVPQEDADVHGQERRLRGRRPRHGGAPPQAEGEPRRPSEDLGPARRLRAHELRGPHGRRDRAARRGPLEGHRDRLDPADGRALAPRAGALPRGLGLLPPARDAARAGRHRGHAPPERAARCS